MKTSKTKIAVKKKAAVKNKSPKEGEIVEKNLHPGEDYAIDDDFEYDEAEGKYVLKKNVDDDSIDFEEEDHFHKHD